MKDKVMNNGKVSCSCSKCHSKNVYYLQQKQVVLPISPSGNLIKNQDNGKWHTLRTLRERLLAFYVGWQAAETECLYLICRDCGENEHVID